MCLNICLLLLLCLILFRLLQGKAELCNWSTGVLGKIYEQGTWIWGAGRDKGRIVISQNDMTNMPCENFADLVPVYLSSLLLFFREKTACFIFIDDLGS